MKVCLKSRYSYYSELRSNADRWSVPLSIEDVTPALSQLVEEAYVRGVLAEELPSETDQLDVEIEPHWSTEPTVERVEVTLSAGTNGDRHIVSHRFDRGPWVRSAESTAQRLRTEGSLTENEQVYRLLVALKTRDGAPREWVLPPLAPPPMIEQSAEELGACQFGDGSLEPDRPVLVSERLVQEAISPMRSGRGDGNRRRGAWKNRPLARSAAGYPNSNRDDTFRDPYRRASHGGPDAVPH